MDINVEGFPLSPQQRHLWKLTRTQPDASPYWASCVVRIRGPLDASVLNTVLTGLAARHEILRTRFYTSEEIATPLQVIAPSTDAAVTIERLDFSGDADSERRAPEALRDRMAQTLAASATAVPQLALASIAPQDHLLVIGMPALRGDRAGLENLVADIAKQYEAALTASGANEEILQYADIAISLNEILESADAEAGRRFWESQDLSNAFTTRLPFERPQAAVEPFAPKRVPVRIPAETAAAGASLAIDRGLPADIFPLTCWQVLLQRTIGTNAVVVSYLSDGRSYAELEQAVGLFARSLPLSGELAGELPFDQAMAHLAERVRAATAWGECFDDRYVRQDRDDTTPFARLAFERIQGGTRRVAGAVSLESEEAVACVDRFVLKLCVRLGDHAPTDVHSAAWIEYDASVCLHDDVRRLAAQLERLLISATTAPTSPIDALRLLPESHEQEIRALFGRSWVAAPVELVHRRFESQAARVSAATAVVCEDASLSYRQLNARANQLAHHLRTLGVGPDSFVGLCLERSVDVAVGILGILKAGGAYLPLDPQLPPARIAGMIGDTGAALVVSRANLTDRLPPTMQTVLLDRDRELLARAPTVDAGISVPPESAVYVLFTSGSTGKPKGVVIEHRQLARYVDAVTAALDLPPDAAFATVTTFAADLGHTSIYPALTSGGCLHIITEARASDPNAFADYFEQHTIDVLKIVPSHLNALLSGARPERVLPRQRLVLGGESSSWDLVDRVHDLAAGCVVFNHYGPTETTVGAAVYRVPRDGARPASATVPIGKPLAHASARVVDRSGELVPFWTAGELCIGGGGVARGYLASPELTQEKFVADPWSSGLGRMYRTGDRVRMLPDGVLEFLGRGDSQIKIRGFRVEVGEVESALRQHPGVRDIAVLAHDAGAGMQLAAFVVSRDRQSLEPADVRTFLHERGLPDYMMPSALVIVDALPLTANGKLDRQRLLASLDEIAAAHTAGEEPMTDWEMRVAGIWRELLAVDEIQARDNFYDLGGHSLLAIQVVTALEKRAQVQISPRDLVFHTLKQFAALCEAKRSQTQTSAASS